MKRVLSIVALLMLTLGTWAGQVIIVKNPTTGGTVTASEAAAGQTCTLTVKPNSGYYLESLTAVTTLDGSSLQAPARRTGLNVAGEELEITSDATADPSGETTHSFTMPTDGSLNVEVTATFLSYQSYNLFIGETQVTELNKDKVLGDGKVMFSVVGNDAPVYTLTLNGAELTVPLFIGLPNLTIDIQGENSITTEETCIQTLNQNDDPSLTFKSTSDEVGSLILTHEGGISQIGEGSVTVSSELAVLLTVYGYNDYTSRLYYMTDGSTSVAKIVPSLGVQVGETQIYSGNADNVFGWYDKDTPTVTFDAENHKLTLNKANISGIIRSSLPNLTIELVGNNSISSGGDRTLQAGSAVNMTIQSTSGNGSLSMHKSYSSSELGNFVDDNVNLTITSPLSLISGDLTSDETENHYYATIGVNYDLWISGTRVTSANASNIWDGANFEFDAASSTLYYRSGASTSYPVLSGLANLNIKIGSADDEGFYTKNNIGIIKFGAPQGVTIAAESGTLTISKLLDDDDAVQQFDIVGSGDEPSLIQGFTTVTYSDFVPMADGITYNTNTKKLVDASGNDWGETTTFVTANGIDISAPTMSGEAIVGADGIKLTLSSDYNYGTIKYSVDYVDGDEEDITDETYDSEDKPIIIKPATVTAKVLINGNEGATATGRYFGFANGNELNVTYGTTQVAMPSLVPTIADTDGITIAKEGNFVDDEQTKINLEEITTIGKAQTTIITSLTASDNTPYTLLNSYVNLNVNILPPAPTIAFDETKTYLNSDKVSISLPEALLEDENATIKYSWDADCEPGNANNYKNDEMVALNAGTNTLYAWVRYNGATANDAVYSERVSQAFTAKTDINQLAVKDLLTAQPTYTGEAIVPPFTLYDAKDETNTVSADNYNVRYIKYMGEAVDFSDVESILGVGTYRVYAVGKGTTYGGEKLIYEVLEVNPATITEVNLSKTSLPYNGKEQTVTITSVKAGELVLGADDYTVTLDEEAVTGDIKATTVGEYTVAVTGQGNFTGNASAIFNIVNRTLVVGEGGDVQFASGQNWATYYSADGDVELPEGIGAFVATGVSDGKLTVSQISYIPEKVAVLLNKNTLTAGTVVFNPEGDTNLLKHADAVVNVDITNDNSAFYGLYNNKMKRLMDNIPAGKNYLKIMIANNVQPHAPLLSIVIEGEGSTTGVSDVSSKMAEVGGDYYDLSGRKLSGKPSKKGLYIQNGKMVVVNNK